MFSGDDRPHIQIGIVYPTANVRAALLFDTFLSTNFAIVGSTGTGKSTSTALILHRIIEKAGGAGNSFAVLGTGRELYARLVEFLCWRVMLFQPALMAGGLTYEKERESLSLLLLTGMSPGKILLEKFKNTFGFNCIKSFTADREFIGRDWFSYLCQNNVPFLSALRTTNWCNGDVVRGP